MKLSIGSKLIVGFMTVAALIAVFGLYAEHVSRTSLKTSAARNSVFLARETLRRVDSSIYQKVEQLQRLGRDAALQEALQASNREFETFSDVEAYLAAQDEKWGRKLQTGADSLVSELVSQDLSAALREKFTEFYAEHYGYPVIAELFVTNRYGANVAQSGPTSDYRQDDEEWWQVAKEKAVFVGDVSYDESVDTYGVSIAVRIDDAAGNFIGVAKEIVGAAEIIREATLAAGEYRSTEISLVTPQGMLVYASTPFKLLADVSGSAWFRRLTGDSGWFEAPRGREKRLFSYARSRGYRSFPGLGWILVVSADLDEVLAPAIRLRSGIVLVSLVLIGAALIAGALVSRTLTRPLSGLQQGVLALARGELGTMVEPKSEDEIGELTRGFNQMSEWLQEYEAELKEEIAQRQRLLEELAIKDQAMSSAVNGIALADLEGRLTYVNEAFLRFWGYDTPEEALGRSVVEFWEDPAAAGAVVEALQQEGAWVGELVARRRDGDLRHLQLSANLVTDDRNAPLCLMGSFVDVTEEREREEKIRRLNRELAQRVRELRDANKELEGFSYSVSHDLRAPLRAIEGFSRILLEDYGGQVDAEGKRLLNVVRRNTRRMAELIDGILAYSRRGRQKLNRARVNMMQLVQEVFENVRAGYPEKDVRLMLDELPPVWGDVTMIREVWSNLLDNAAKFSRREDPAVIEVGTMRNDDETAYYVRDNGVGFDMRYADKLFGMFQRLHGEKEFPGTGVGLSIVQRIVQRHGGRVWAKGEVNQGATVYFTLPGKGGSVNDTGSGGDLAGGG